MNTLNPFLIWLGGKRRSLPALLAKIPNKIEGMYFEPFVGGGALFFALASEGRIKKARLSDVNEELIYTYMAVRDNVEEVINILNGYQNTEEFFYEIRALDPNHLVIEERAARLIYLNKTCFNGLYRVNSSVKFNSPYGHNPKAKFCEIEKLYAASYALQIAEIAHEDFAETLMLPIEGDFVYCDPPYIPITISSFVSYTKNGFDISRQIELANSAYLLKKKGVNVLLSNSAAPAAKALYRDGFTVEEISVSRALAIGAGAPKKAQELIIY
jgi:DNA adenine methylase